MGTTVANSDFTPGPWYLTGEDDRRSFEIKSVFNKWLGAKARELAAAGTIQIIEANDFPEGAPIHEDGSSEYDPRKPLVLFAVLLSGTRAKTAWANVEPVSA
jgi:CO dehydrogenase/acetyl-CoA synthase alpha subunit